jgi:Domain of unknown function (DUF4282)
MPDRSPHQGLPDEWNHGSHAAREPFPTAGASDGHGAGRTGSHRARTADGYGAGPAEAYGAGQADGFGARPDALGARPDSFGVAQTDGFGARPDALGARPNSFGAAQTDAFGARSAGTYGAGAANPFGDADPFRSRTSEPFEPATTAEFSAVTADAGTARTETERPAAAIGDLRLDETADTKGFLGALFDFGFTSFVTPKVVKVLYVLIVIGTVVSALVSTIIVFKASVPLGFLMLVFGDPLFILVALAIYRVILEFFVVTFRVAEDIRTLRERGPLS